MIILPELRQTGEFCDVKHKYSFIQVESSISLVPKASWDLVGIQTFLYKKATAHPSHLSLSLSAKKDERDTQCCMKDASSADVEWSGVGYISLVWVREVSCSLSSMQKTSLAQKPNTNMGIIKVFLDNKDFIRKWALDLIELLQFFESSRD